MEEVRARSCDGQITGGGQHERKTRGRNDGTEDGSDGEIIQTQIWVGQGWGGGDETRGRWKQWRMKKAEQETYNIQSGFGERSNDPSC